MDSLLFYSHHSVGLGHLVRSLSLARKLAERFRVTLLCGGKMPEFDCRPPGVDTISLPFLMMSAEGKWMAPDSDAAQRLLEERQRSILEFFDRVRPSVVLVEFYPFGRMQYSSEILALLEAARCSSRRPLVVCSVRDLLERRREHQQIYDDFASVFANHLYDGVLVHSDPRLIRFEETFLPSIPMRTPLYYTGYVEPYAQVPEGGATRDDRAWGIIVSCGGGNIPGSHLLHCALEAHARHLLPRGMPLHLVAGQLLPEGDWNALQSAAAGIPGVDVRRWIPNLVGALRHAAASISQFGYNTFLDLMGSGVPALAVPYQTPLDEEQTRRAEILEDRGVIRVLHPSDLTPERLAREVELTLQNRPRRLTIDIGGASRTAAIVDALRRGAQPDALSRDSPLTAVLDA